MNPYEAPQTPTVQEARRLLLILWWLCIICIIILCMMCLFSALIAAIHAFIITWQRTEYNGRPLAVAVLIFFGSGIAASGLMNTAELIEKHINRRM